MKLRVERRRILRWVFGVAGLTFIAAALVRTWNRTGEISLPEAATMGVAGLLVLAGLAGAGRSWLSLFDRGARSQLLADFYMAQLGKYIPGGGLWQAAGQVGFAADSGLTKTRVAAAFAVHAVIQLVAAAFVGGFVVLDASVAPWLRAVAALGIAAPLLLHRAWMAGVLQWLGRRLRLDGAEVDPPAQGAIVRSGIWGLAPIVGFGLAFGALVHDLDPALGILAATAAFALAWAVGFAVLPVPSGLGVREAVLVVLLGGEAGVVVAASVGLRLLAIIGELVMVGITRRLRR